MPSNASENKSVFILRCSSSCSSRAPGAGSPRLIIISSSSSEASLALHQSLNVAPHPHLSHACILVVTHVLLLVTQSLAEVVLLLNPTTVLLPVRLYVHHYQQIIFTLRLYNCVVGKGRNKPQIFSLAHQSLCNHSTRSVEWSK